MSEPERQWTRLHKTLDPNRGYILNGSGEAQRLSGANVSGESFSLLGVHMALGRDFLPQEDRPGNDELPGSHQTHRHANAHQLPRLAKNSAQHGPAARSNRHANAELPRALIHAVF